MMEVNNDVTRLRLCHVKTFANRDDYQLPSLLHSHLFSPCTTVEETLKIDPREGLPVSASKLQKLELESHSAYPRGDETFFFLE